MSDEELSNTFEDILLKSGAGKDFGRLAEFEDTEGDVVKLITWVRGFRNEPDVGFVGQPTALALHESLGYGLVMQTDDCRNWQGTAVFSLIPVKSNKFRFSKFEKPRDVEYGTPLAEALIKAETHTPGFPEVW